MEKLPPIEKLYEAYSAIADGRVHIQGTQAEIVSSNYQKTYKVKWDEMTISSTDPATYWQGYPGYPVCAILLLQNKCTMDSTVISWFSKIPWKELNEKHKRDYAAAAQEAMAKFTDRQKEKALECAQRNLNELVGLTLTLKRGRK